MRALVLAVACVLLSSCGMEFKSNSEAIQALRELPLTSVHSLNDANDASYEQLEAALVEFAPETSGSTRGIFGRRKANLKDLRNLFQLVKSGEGESVDSLAYGLVEMNGGTVRQTAASLGGILDIIKVIGPIIGSIFPGLGPIIEALLKILPAILAIFGL